MKNYGEDLKLRAEKAREDFKRHLKEVKNRQAEWLQKLTKEDVKDAMDTLMGRVERALDEATEPYDAGDSDMQL